MRKRKNVNVNKGLDATSRNVEVKKKKLPVYTRLAYMSATAVIIIGIIVQLVLAIIVYGRLPSMILTSWIGIGTPTQTMPSWIVFIAFPISQIILLIVAHFSPKDSEGHNVMEWGKAISLILLTILFTALQGSAFKL
ncbi:MAG: hypothetical protein ACYC0V_13460 [Armatimonadota bacterium]